MIRRLRRWRPGRPRLWPPTYLKYLLVYPIVQAYRRRTRRSLRWRLAGSHFTTVFLSVVALSLLGIVVALVAARIQLPSAGEAPLEAWELAESLGPIQAEGKLTPDQMSGLLAGLTTGRFAPNAYDSNVTFNLEIGKHFARVRSISIVGRDGIVASSSDPALIGRPASSIDPSVEGLVDIAKRSADPTRLKQLSAVAGDGRGVLGAYGIESNGAIDSVLVIDKYKRAFPEGWGIVWTSLNFATQIGVFLLVAMGVPAIPIGIFMGIRRAKAISRPISNLAVAADSFASGNLDTRITVEGEDEIAGLERSFNTMADDLRSTMAKEATARARAEDLLAANRDLVANVSHELRTPVALIRGHLEALEQSPAENAAYLAIALRETDRLERLVDDLFQLTRVESNRLALQLTAFDAGSAVREAVESLAEPARREAGVAVRSATDPGDVSVYGDRSRTVQVLLNLIRNAIRYTPEGGIILLTASPVAEGVRIVVRDTGMGIAPSDLPHIFERFYRAEHSRNRSSGGSGLGLAIARELIDAMGGRIAVESALDEGTAFTITLPRPPAAPIDRELGHRGSPRQAVSSLASK